TATSRCSPCCRAPRQTSLVVISPSGPRAPKESVASDRGSLASSRTLQDPGAEPALKVTTTGGMGLQESPLGLELDTVSWVPARDLSPPVATRSKHVPTTARTPQVTL